MMIPIKDRVREMGKTVWRKPSNSEIELVSRTVQHKDSKVLRTCRMMLCAITLLVLLSILLIVFNHGIYHGYNLLYLFCLGIGILSCLVYIILKMPKCLCRLKNTDTGNFLVCDTKVVSKNSTHRQHKGMMIHTYTLEVKMIHSQKGGDQDKRTFKVDQFDYEHSPVGGKGIIVRYDVNLDLKPFFSPDYYPIIHNTSET